MSQKKLAEAVKNIEWLSDVNGIQTACGRKFTRRVSII